MATHPQVKANQENAQHSTGPRTDTGKATSSINHCKHGLTGHFRLLPWEDATRYYAMLEDLRHEHQPDSVTEHMLVEKMAQHYWISQRAQLLADVCMDPEKGVLADEKQFALFMRYQTTHERAFHKCLNDLLKLRAEKRKQTIGFECGTCKIPTIGSGEVLVGASFEEADTGLHCEAVA